MNARSSLLAHEALFLQTLSHSSAESACRSRLTHSHVSCRDRCTSRGRLGFFWWSLSRVGSSVKSLRKTSVTDGTEHSLLVGRSLVIRGYTPPSKVRLPSLLGTVPAVTGRLPLLPRGLGAGPWRGTGFLSFHGGSEPDRGHATGFLSLASSAYGAQVARKSHCSLQIHTHGAARGLQN